MSVDSLAPVQQLLAVFKIVAHHELTVPLGGGRARAQMKHCTDLPQVLTGQHSRHEIVAVQIIADM
jgi:hypothetical protein